MADLNALNNEGIGNANRSSKKRCLGFDQLSLGPNQLNLVLIASIPIVLVSVGFCYHIAGIATDPLKSWTPVRAEISESDIELSIPRLFSKIYHSSGIKELHFEPPFLSTQFHTHDPITMTSQELTGQVWCSFKTR